MRDGIDKENDLSGVIFTGGVSREGINSIVKGLSEKGAKQLRGILTSHIGQPGSLEGIVVVLCRAGEVHLYRPAVQYPFGL